MTTCTSSPDNALQGRCDIPESAGLSRQRIGRTRDLLRDRRVLMGHHIKLSHGLGDFNNPGSRDDATASLLSHLSDYCDYTLHPVDEKTFPSPLPRRALDFVFLPAGCTQVRCEVVRSLLSDHLPVLVEFNI